MSEDVKIAKDSIDEETVEGVRSLEADKYKYGFDSDIEQEFAPKGLNEDIVRFISAKKDESIIRRSTFRTCIITPHQ